MRNLFILLSFLMLLGCSSSKFENAIVGEWSVTKFESHLQGISPELINEGSIIALSSNYAFRSDSTVTLVYRGNMNGGKGKWTYTDGLSELLIVYDGINLSKEKFIVQRISASKMVLKQEVDGYGYILLTLKKK